MTAIICGKRRFTCLSPRLVRLEFSPSGTFEDRRSLAAYHRPQPLPFDSVEQQGDDLTLRVGGITIYSRQNESDFFHANLRVDFKVEGCTQTWRFGDRDYRNLGGAVRSLDYYGRECLLEGVHPASNASPNDFFHFETELFDLARIYIQDGHLDWQAQIAREGVYDMLRYAPERVYNRYVNMAGDLTRFQPGLLSRNGYFLLNDSSGAVLDDHNIPVERDAPGGRDLYFFAYGRDYRAALGDYRLLCGAAPLPSKNIFGIIFSRWPALNDSEARMLIERFRQEGIPLSALMLDLEWHVPDFAHWDWNPETFPRPEAFLEWAHHQGVLVAVNVHPQYIPSSDSHFEPFIQAAGGQAKVQPVWANMMAALTVKSGADRVISPDLANPAVARTMQDLCCAPVLRQGVDYWWLDGASAQINGADDQLISSKVFYETTERGERRGMLQARYGGIGSHRYGVMFTGDTHSQWEVLQSECEFNIRAGQVGMAYVSHDIGGFSHSEAPVIDPDLYIRWLEFGVFNPVLRFHSAPGAGSRQPWDYGARNLEIARRWMQTRLSLVPYIYNAARQSYETGVPLVRGLYLDEPNREDCYRFDQYLFGDSLLVAPILTPSNHRSVTLAEGGWYELETGKLLAGGRTIHVFAGLDQVPVYVKAGSILTRQKLPQQRADIFDPAQTFVRDLWLDVYPGADGEAVLYEDDGYTRAYQQDGFCQTRFQVSERDGKVKICAMPASGACPGESRNIQVRVALAGGEVFFRNVQLPAERISLDPTSARMVIDLGCCPVHEGWELRIG